MLESHGEEFIFRNVNVILLADILLLDFVLKNTTAETTAPNTFKVVIINSLLFLGSDTVGFTFNLFLVESILETPLNVRDWGVFDVLLYVIEGVLGDVGDTKVVMDEETGVGGVGGLCVSYNHFDESCFTCGVR